MLLYQQPGNGGGVAQINRELDMRAAQKRMLTGQPANQARQIRVVGQVLVPQVRMAYLAYAIKAVTVAIVQGRAQVRLAGRNT